MNQPAQFIIIAPSSLGESCLAVPAVRAIVGELGKENVIIGARKDLVSLWEREVGEVVNLGNAPSYGAMQKAFKGYADHVVINFLSEEMRKFWGDPAKLFVIKKEHEKALGTSIPFSNRKGLLHQVERYLSAPQLFNFETKKREYFPQYKERELSGKFAAHPTSEYGKAYYNGLQGYYESFGSPIDSKQTTLLEYDLEAHKKGQQFTAEQGDKVSLEKMTLERKMDWLGELDLLIAPEGDLVHLAAYLGVPTVTIFGPGNPDATRPLGLFHSVVSTKVECQPCLMAKCLLDQRCTKRISSVQIQAALVDLISRIQN